MPRRILRPETDASSRYHINSSFPDDARTTVSSQAPLSGYSDAGSFKPEVPKVSKKERLEFLTHEATLSNVRRRISQKTGIDKNYLRGVCVNGQLQMYRECGYDDKLLARPAKQEEEEAKALRKQLNIHERGRFKADLAKVISQTLNVSYNELLQMRTAKFNDMAVRTVAVMTSYSAKKNPRSKSS